MTAELTAQQKFEEKLIERIRDNIGDLMPDDVLKDIIEKAMHKIFFDNVIQEHEYGRKTIEPPWINQIVKECVETRVDELMTEWMVENEDKMEAIIKDLMAEGVGSLLLKSFNNLFSEQMANLGNELLSRMRNM